MKTHMHFWDTISTSMQTKHEQEEAAVAAGKEANNG